MDVVVVDTPTLRAGHEAVRRAVFVGEQGVTEAEEMDGRDDLPGTLLIAAVDADGTVIGSGRLLDLDTEHAHVGRVAILPTVRGTGLGRVLMEGIERVALGRTTGPLTLVLDAQEYAQGFYAALGYERTPRERFLDARLWHVEMSKVVRP